MKYVNIRELLNTKQLKAAVIIILVFFIIGCQSEINKSNNDTYEIEIDEVDLQINQMDIQENEGESTESETESTIENEADNNVDHPETENIKDIARSMMTELQIRKLFKARNMEYSEDLDKFYYALSETQADIYLNQKFD